MPEARNSAEVAHSNERLRIAMEEDLERDFEDEELETPNPPQRAQNGRQNVIGNVT